MFVKFCGFTRSEDVEAVKSLAVSAVGFVFHETSKRRVTPEQARSLGSLLDGTGILRVGVFVDTPVEDIRAIADYARLDMLQLYRDEARRVLARFRPVIAACRVGEGIDPAVAAMAAGERGEVLLLDSLRAGEYGGTGPSFEWERLRDFPHLRRTIVAGGVNEHNVGSLVSAIRPYGIDVSTGIEDAPGVKSETKMKAILEHIRRNES